MSWLDVFFSGYNKIQVAGAPLPPETILNFGSGVPTFSDDPIGKVTTVNVSAPGAVIGSATIGVNSTVVEGSTDWVLVNANQTAAILTMPQPAIAFKETVSMSAYVQITSQTGGHVGRFSRLIEVTSNAGTITTPNGGTSDSNTTADPSNNLDPFLAGASAQIVISGATLLVQVTAPASVTIFARASYSVDRGLLPGTGPTPVVLTATPNNGPGAGGTSVTLTGSHFTGATSVTLFGVTASFSVVNDSTITCTSGPFFGVPGAGDIIVTNANGPGSLPGGWTYSSSGATPLTILGTAPGNGVLAWGPGSSLQHTGGTANTWNDAGPNGHNVPVQHGAPGYNATDANFNGKPSASFVTGTPGDQFQLSLNLGAADLSIFTWVIYRSTITTPQGVIGFDQGLQLEQGVTAGKPSAFSGNGASPSRDVWGSTTTSTAEAVVGYAQGAASGTVSLSISVGNGAPVSSSGSGLGLTQTGNLTIGGPASFSAFTNTITGTIAEWGVAVYPGNSTGPTSGQLAALESYFQLTYGVP